MTAERLRAAIDAYLTGTRAASLGGAVDDLMTAYRSAEVPDRVLLGSDREVAAYAAYRMPATYVAVRAALHQTATALPGWAPASVVDAGAGTGAASWAVADAFPAATLTLLEQSEPAMRVGRALGLPRAEWRSWRMAGAVDLPPADLVVCAYVLGEVPEATRAAFVAAVVDRAGAVLLVEPGTPPGYARVVAARRALVEAGWRLVAPCPHEAECPLAGTRDWCHFAARVERSALHRRLKDARLGWEDEKYSFVAAVRAGSPDWPEARVLRHPQTRKGLVSLELCVADGRAERRLVGKREGGVYRAARKVSWGDRWEPSAAPVAGEEPQPLPRGDLEA
ncbi:MAG TPA: small ribosomal subunit Rsm22 family protein [Mycobacteriales bacterium]